MSLSRQLGLQNCYLTDLNYIGPGLTNEAWCFNTHAIKIV